MSTDLLALLKTTLPFRPVLRALADSDTQDLRQSDRDVLRKALLTSGFLTTAGSLGGCSLGIFLAFRIRSSRRALLRAFKTAEKPKTVRFADGREENLPDLTPLLRSSTLGNVATYTLLGAGGFSLGSLMGSPMASVSAGRSILKDRETGERIQIAFKKFQADALRTQLKMLEQSVEHEGEHGSP